MQFPVPQFIDVEDKIIGPFTLKQFGFVFAGGVIIALLFKVLQVSITFFLLAIPILLLTLFFSFGSFNGKKVYQSIPIFIKFLTAPKVMVFKKESDIDGLRVSMITAEQVQAMNKKTEQDNIVGEPVQTQLKRLSRLLDQKNAEETEIVTKKV